MVKYKIYAAYGSNMNLQQMSHRCPTARVIGTGIIKDYELLFRGTSGSAVATIEYKDGKSVPVLLWKITYGDNIPNDERNLDIYEGFPRLYRKEMIKVELSNGDNIEAMVYIKNYGKIAKPSEYYYQIIEQGYLKNGIDLSYLKNALKYVL